MTGMQRIMHMRQTIVLTVLVAILLVLLSSPFASAVDEPLVCVIEHSCCVVYIEVDEPPCCNPEASACCFSLYPPPVYEFYFVSPQVVDAVCVEQFYFRDSCDFIFEPPKV